MHVVTAVCLNGTLPVKRGQGQTKVRFALNYQTKLTSQPQRRNEETRMGCCHGKEDDDGRDVGLMLVVYQPKKN